MKIAVIRALYLGDMICAVPALRKLRQLYPRAAITLIGLAWEREFVERFHKYVDRFMEFPGWPGLPEQPIEPKKIVSWLKQQQKEQWDLVIQMQGDGSYINSMVELMGAKKVWGFGLGVDYPHKGTEIERLLRLVGGGSKRLEWPIQEEYDFPLERYHYVIVHPGAKDPKRRWGEENFAKVAKAVKEKGYQVVITGVKGEEVTIEGTMNLVGRTTLSSLGVLVSRAKLVICNDTGISHLAAALNKPSVVIMVREDERWKPLNQELHTVIQGRAQDSLKQVLRNSYLLLA